MVLPLAHRLIAQSERPAQGSANGHQQCGGGPAYGQFWFGPIISLGCETSLAELPTLRGRGSDRSRTVQRTLCLGLALAG
jgi:hypothetical protein